MSYCVVIYDEAGVRLVVGPFRSKARALARQDAERATGWRAEVWPLVRQEPKP